MTTEQSPAIPDAWVEAAAEAHYESTYPDDKWADDADIHHMYLRDMEVALSAVLPLIAGAIEAEGISADAGRNPMTGQESPDAHLHAAYNDGILVAARIVRGGHHD